MSDEPRERTIEEVREEFLRRVWAYVRYWENESRAVATRGQLEGLAFSMLVLLDGGSGFFPGCLLVPNPHPEDKEYNRENGENWYPQPPQDVEMCDIGGALHESLRHYKPKD